MGLQRFLGMTNFYRRFISNYSRICRSLHDLTGNVPYVWTEAQQQAFETLKQAFEKEPVLRHLDSTAPMHIEADASNYAMGAVLSQADPEGHFHPVAFFSKSFGPAERNYDIHDKELLAIVCAFREWRPWLAGSRGILVHTDHRNLEYFFSKNIFKQRHWRWREELGQFDWILRYRSGSEQKVADALSRKEELKSQYDLEIEEIEPEPLLSPRRWTQPTTSKEPRPNLLPLGPESGNAGSVEQALEVFHAQSRESLGDEDPDEFPQEPYDIFAELLRWNRLEPKFYVEGPDIVFRNGLATRDNKWLVPPDERLRYKIVAQRHDVPTAGHRGVEKTYHLVRADFHWTGLRRTVQRYVGSCATCVRAKKPTHKPYGLLVPLPTPQGPWKSISLDFICGLPDSCGATRILTVVDRFTKMVRLLPCIKDLSSEGLTHLFEEAIVRAYGYPDDIVSDRDPLVTQGFWAEIMNAASIVRNMSTSFHPQSDGQSERVNQVVEQILRCYVSYSQTDWLKYLWTVEVAINNSVHSSTGATPFEAAYGFAPKFDRFQFPRNATSNPEVPVHLDRIKEVQERVREEIEKAKAKYKFFEDKYRQEHPEFPDNSLVYLRTTNLSSTRQDQFRKLGPVAVGPYRVVKKVGKVSYRLELPEQMEKKFPTFHVSLLEGFTPSPNDARDRDEPPTHLHGPAVEIARVVRVIELQQRKSTSRQSNHQDRWMYLVQYSTNPDDVRWRDAGIVQQVAPEQCRRFHSERWRPEWPSELRDIATIFEQETADPQEVSEQERRLVRGRTSERSLLDRIE